MNNMVYIYTDPSSTSWKIISSDQSSYWLKERKTLTELQKY